MCLKSSFFTTLIPVFLHLSDFRRQSIASTPGKFKSSFCPSCVQPIFSVILANVVREGAFREQPLSTFPTLEVVLPGLLLALPDLPVLPLDVPEEQLLTLAPPRAVRATDQFT